ncbi:MAG TPA: ABC transporter substrate-binding protein [Candidatus Paceibacterota bacterium]
MNKRGWWIVLIIIVVVIVIVASRGSKKTDVTSTEKTPVKIGVSLPLTGSLAFIGETDKNAALIAQEEIAANKNLKHSYELVFEDDAFDAQKGASSINKLVNVDKVSGLISVGSTVGNVATPIAEASKVPHIGMASDPNVAKGQYNFIHWTRPQEEVTALVSELQRRKLTKVAIIGLNQQGFKAIEDDFVEKARVAGITVVGNETFNTGQKDFRTIIAKLQKTNPQIYLLGAFDPEIGIMAKQMQSAGIKTPLTSVESFGLTSDATPFEGQWYVDSAVPSATFVQNYQTKYGKEPGPAAGNVYDAIHLFVRAAESIQGEVTHDKIAEALSKDSSYTGALGALTSNSDGIFISQAAVKIIKNGKPEVFIVQ